MGYSSRYHAASLAAVFLALAIGILIGAGLGNDVVRRETRNLEESLKSNVVEARDRADALQAELDREREFTDRVYPLLTAGALRGDRIAIVALGGLSEELSGEIRGALEPTGAKLGEVATVREPPDLSGLGGELEGKRFRRLARNPDALRALGVSVGRSLVAGDGTFERLRDTLLSSFSGRVAPVDGVVVVRAELSDLDPRAQDATGTLEGGLLDGLADAHVPAVGVERSDTDPSSIGVFDAHGLASVDSIDLSSGEVALVYALAGARGSFGVKGTADRLIPKPPRRAHGTASP